MRGETWGREGQASQGRTRVARFGGSAYVRKLGGAQGAVASARAPVRPSSCIGHPPQVAIPMHRSCRISSGCGSIRRRARAARPARTLPLDGGHEEGVAEPALFAARAVKERPCCPCTAQARAQRRPSCLRTTQEAPARRFLRGETGRQAASRPRQPRPPTRVHRPPPARRTDEEG